MPYQVENLSPETLRRIFLVLKEIKLASEIRGRKYFLRLEIKDLKSISEDNYRKIIQSLLKYKIIKGKYWTVLFLDLPFISIDKNFFDFYEKVWKELHPKEKRKKPKKKLKVKEYNEETRILTIGDFEIPIAKNKGNNNAHEIMSYIFIDKIEKLEEEFFYSEIAEDRFGCEYNPQGENPFQPYSGACERINENIKDFTKGEIEEFLIFNHSKKAGSVKINQEYIL